MIVKLFKKLEKINQMKYTCQYTLFVHSIPLNLPLPSQRIGINLSWSHSLHIFLFNYIHRYTQYLTINVLKNLPIIIPSYNISPIPSFHFKSRIVRTKDTQYNFKRFTIISITPRKRSEVRLGEYAWNKNERKSRRRKGRERMVRGGSLRAREGGPN